MEGNLKFRLMGLGIDSHDDNQSALPSIAPRCLWRRHCAVNLFLTGLESHPNASSASRDVGGALGFCKSCHCCGLGSLSSKRQMRFSTDRGDPWKGFVTEVFCRCSWFLVAFSNEILASHDPSDGPRPLGLSQSCISPPFCRHISPCLFSWLPLLCDAMRCYTPCAPCLCLQPHRFGRGFGLALDASRERLERPITYGKVEGFGRLVGRYRVQRSHLGSRGASFAELSEADGRRAPCKGSPAVIWQQAHCPCKEYETGRRRNKCQKCH